jgi:recombinational DNA repair protein (RecF pathway)
VEPNFSSCVLCGRGEGEVPLIAFRFRGEGRVICSQHLPVLIHDPAQLVGRLQGAERLEPAEHKD